jgi:hypothetical protein
MRILGILFCIAVLVLVAASVYADSKWRKWMAQRKQERGGDAKGWNGRH